jgi:hypothetical protein
MVRPSAKAGVTMVRTGLVRLRGWAARQSDLC